MNSKGYNYIFHKDQRNSRNDVKKFTLKGHKLLNDAVNFLMSSLTVAENFVS